MKLADTMNTYNPALGIILKKGYEVTIIDQEEFFDWKAVKRNEEFIASDPLRLLSLIIIFEEKRENWNIYKKNYDKILKFFMENNQIYYNEARTIDFLDSFIW